MTAAELAARRAATQQSFYRAFGGVDLAPGVFASVVPAAPARSLFNAVTYTDSAPSLADAPALYAEAGIRAWTVWVHPEDGGLAESLAAGGHALDATPEAMGAVLAELELDGPDIGVPASWGDVVETNAAAYGVAADELRAMELAAPVTHAYSAEDGAVVLAIHDHDGDAGVTFVAARPEARGRGIVAALMRQSLRDAMGRGCLTTTLEATKLGLPVYERLGYRSLGTLEMWEKRTPA